MVYSYILVYIIDINMISIKSNEQNLVNEGKLLCHFMSRCLFVHLLSEHDDAVDNIGKIGYDTSLIIIYYEEYY